MSLQTRLSALITAIGVDIKELKARKPTVLSEVNAITDSTEPGSAIEWRNGGVGGGLLAKIVGMNPIPPGPPVVSNRTELWVRTKSRDGLLSAERKLLDTDGKSDLLLNNASVLAAYLNSWTTATRPVHYWTDGATVRLSGNVSGAAATASTLMTLPAGFRPLTAVRIATVWWNNTVWQTGTITINTNGNVDIVTANNVFSNTMQIVAIEAHFRLDR